MQITGLMESTYYLNCNRLFLLLTKADGPSGIWYDTRAVTTKGPYLFCRTTSELLINFEFQLVPKNADVEPVYFITFLRLTKTDQWILNGLVSIYFLSIK